MAQGQGSVVGSDRDPGLGIPCGGMDYKSVPGIPAGWTSQSLPQHDCGGNDWYATSRTHFIPSIGFKVPFTNGNIYPLQTSPTEPGQTYIAERLALMTQANSCGVHEYPGGKTNNPIENTLIGVNQIRDVVQRTAAGQIGAARDFAAYNLGIGVICYLDTSDPAH